jgi:hypothetical protein
LTLHVEAALDAVKEAALDAVKEAALDAVKPVLQCVQTHSNPGFMSFWLIRDARLAVPALPEFSSRAPGARPRRASYVILGVNQLTGGPGSAVR